MIISVDGEKALSKIQHSFMIKKNSQKTGNERKFVNLRKGIYEKLTANIKLAEF